VSWSLWEYPLPLAQQVQWQCLFYLLLERRVTVIDLKQKTTEVNNL
jgi:hypothetical protein